MLMLYELIFDELRPFPHALQSEHSIDNKSNKEQAAAKMTPHIDELIVNVKHGFNYRSH